MHFTYEAASATHASCENPHTSRPPSGRTQHPEICGMGPPRARRQITGWPQQVQKQSSLDLSVEDKVSPHPAHEGTAHWGGLSGEQVNKP